jgi:hypothetical protein
MEGKDFASYWWKCLELDDKQATVVDWKGISGPAE